MHEDILALVQGLAENEVSAALEEVRASDGSAVSQGALLEAMRFSSKLKNVAADRATNQARTLFSLIESDVPDAPRDLPFDTRGMDVDELRALQHFASGRALPPEGQPPKIREDDYEALLRTIQSAAPAPRTARAPQEVPRASDDQSYCSRDDYSDTESRNGARTGRRKGESDDRYSDASRRRDNKRRDGDDSSQTSRRRGSSRESRTPRDEYDDYEATPRNGRRQRGDQTTRPRGGYPDERAPYDSRGPPPPSRPYPAPPPPQSTTRYAPPVPPPRPPGGPPGYPQVPGYEQVPYRAPYTPPSPPPQPAPLYGSYAAPPAAAPAPYADPRYTDVGYGAARSPLPINPAFLLDPRFISPRRRRRWRDEWGRPDGEWRGPRRGWERGPPPRRAPPPRDWDADDLDGEYAGEAPPAAARGGAVAGTGARSGRDLTELLSLAHRAVEQNNAVLEGLSRLSTTPAAPGAQLALNTSAASAAARTGPGWNLPEPPLTPSVHGGAAVASHPRRDRDQRARAPPPDRREQIAAGASGAAFSKLRVDIGGKTYLVADPGLCDWTVRELIDVAMLRANRTNPQPVGIREIAYQGAVLGENDLLRDIIEEENPVLVANPLPGTAQDAGSASGAVAAAASGGVDVSAMPYHSLVALLQTEDDVPLIESVAREIARRAASPRARAAAAAASASRDVSKPPPAPVPTAVATVAAPAPAVVQKDIDHTELIRQYASLAASKGVGLAESAAAGKQIAMPGQPDAAGQLDNIKARLTSALKRVGTQTLLELAASFDGKQAPRSDGLRGPSRGGHADSSYVSDDSGDDDRAPPRRGERQRYSDYDNDDRRLSPRSARQRTPGYDSDLASSDIDRSDLDRSARDDERSVDGRGRGGYASARGRANTDSNDEYPYKQ